MFDPYHKWLGIPPDRRPPTHYELLSISPQERDREVIEEAAIRQSAHLRTYQTGPHAIECTRLLNEVAQARLVLSDPAKRKAYDVTLAPKGKPAEVAPLRLERNTPASGKKTIHPAHTSRRQPVAKSPSRAMIIAVALASAGIAVALALMNRASRQTESRSQLAERETGSVEKLGAGPPGSGFAATDADRRSSRSESAINRRRTASDSASRPSASEDMPPAKPVEKGDADKPTLPEPTPPPPLVVKSPIPDADARKRTEAMVRDTFKADFDKALSSAQKRSLAQKLLKQALDTKDDVAARFILFHEAGDLAAQAGNLPLVYRCIDHLAKEFEVDTLVLKTAALSTLAVQVPSKDVVDAIFRLVDEAVRAERFDLALKLAQVVESAAPTIKEDALIARAHQLVKDVEEIEKEADLARATGETLKTIPDDPHANLKLGRYLCFIKCQWQEGFPLLVKGSDAKVEALARKELAVPKDGAALLELADGWWDYTDSLKGAARINVLRRVIEIYQDAVPELTGLLRAKAERRILAAAEQLPEEPVGEARAMEGHQGPVGGVAFSPNGRLAASSGADGTVRIWDLARGKESQRFDGHCDRCSKVAFSPNGKYLVSSAADMIVRVWGIEEGNLIQQFKGHTGGLGEVAFTSDGKRVLSNSTDNTVRLWDVETGQQIRSFSGPPGSSASMGFAISHDGAMLVTGGIDKVLLFWDIESGRQLRRCPGHRAEIFAVAVSTDGRRIASGGQDKIVRIWSTENGQCTAQMSGHRQRIISMAFSPNGRYLLSAGDDSLRLWDVEAGKELYRPAAGGETTGKVNRPTFSPDGRRALFACEDGKVRLWSMPK